MRPHTATLVGIALLMPACGDGFVAPARAPRELTRVPLVFEERLRLTTIYYPGAERRSCDALISAREQQLPRQLTDTLRRAGYRVRAEQRRTPAPELKVSGTATCVEASGAFESGERLIVRLWLTVEAGSSLLVEVDGLAQDDQQEIDGLGELVNALTASAAFRDYAKSWPSAAPGRPLP